MPRVSDKPTRHNASLRPRTLSCFPPTGSQTPDGFWRGVVLIERKSRGERLDRAEIQAFDYMQNLQRTGQGDGLAWLKPGTEPSRARTTRSEPRSKCSDTARKPWETRSGSTAQAE